jgi:hypothetical protein
MSMTLKDPQPARRPDARYDSFRVTPWVHHLGRHVTRHRDLWLRLGNFESRVLREDFDGIAIERPVFICGLARSGTTILLEVLARHTELGSHRYRDDPFLFTPIFWNRFLDRMPARPAEAAERAHGDGIAVTPDSPEAFEEILWMAFFEGLHDPHHSSVVTAAASCPAFEDFFRDHIRKLLWVRRRRRYLSKANYNLTRMEYLLKLFPDARFLVPVRAPAAHIASLMKQHRLFREGERRHPRALAHMRRIGHFEFGLDHRPINLGDGSAAAVRQAFEAGDELRGWALYWASLHDWLADRLAASARLRRAVRVVRFEDLCARSLTTLEDVFAHCGLPDRDGLIAASALGLHAPTYYRPDFSENDLDLIDDLTGPAAARLGYGDPAPGAVMPPRSGRG